MAQTSVAQFATQLKMQAGALLEQLQNAGVGRRHADDLLSEQDKSKLLEYLRRSHGRADGKTKITLTRKETTEIRSQDAHGKSHTVQVEVRKKRVLVKRDPLEARVEPPVTAPEVLAEPVARDLVAVSTEPVSEARAEVPQTVVPPVEVKAEPVVEVKVEVKVEPVVEVKAEVKAEPVAKKAEPVGKGKAEPIGKGKSEPGGNCKAGPLVEVKAGPPVAEKVQSPVEAKVEPSADLKAGAGEVG